MKKQPIEVGCTVRTDNPWPIEGQVIEKRGQVNGEQYWHVKSGVTTMSLKESELTRVEPKPKREHVFIFADGSEIKRKVSECYIILPQGEAHTPVILGEEGDEALLGVVTLEILDLIFDPFKRELRPMRMLLV